MIVTWKNKTTWQAEDKKAAYSTPWFSLTVLFSLAPYPVVLRGTGGEEEERGTLVLLVAPESLPLPCFRGSCLHRGAQMTGLGLQHGCDTILVSLSGPTGGPHSLRNGQRLWGSVWERMGLWGMSRACRGYYANSAHRCALFLRSINMCCSKDSHRPLENSCSCQGDERQGNK